MGMIQQAINQTLGSAAVAARFAPDYEQKLEIYQGKKAINALTTAEGEARATDREPFAQSLELQRIERAAQLYSKYPQSKEASYFRKMLPITTPSDNLDTAMNANANADARFISRRTQADNFRQSILLNAQGLNIMVPRENKRK